MQKCPKCGTILDDSKKKCYMCGQELTKKAPLSASTFNRTTNSVVTQGQDNVFNNGKTIKNETIEVLGEDDSMLTRSVSTNVFGNELNKFNTLGFGKTNDEQSKKEPPKEEPKKEESKKEEPKPVEKKKEEPKPKKEEKPKEEKKVDLPKEKKKIDFGLPKPEPEKKNNQEPFINWGDNLKKESRPKKKMDPSLIVNIAGLVLFAAAIIFVLYNVRKKPEDKTVSLGALTYKISNFELKENESNSKYYTYGDTCALKVETGSTTQSSTFIDNYFDQQKENYVTDENAKATISQLKINDNTWYELNIVYFIDNPGSNSGVSSITKYKYVAITKDNKFYTITYVNPNDEAVCSSSFDSFLDSLDFE